MDNAPKFLSTVDDCIKYFREIIKQIEDVQSILPYSEIINILDDTKALINKTKYKLIFLK
jgi:phospholipid N-methyltransferase